LVIPPKDADTWIEMDTQAADPDVVQAAYRLIGVPSDSSPLRIKRAYRELSKTWHPDKFPPGSHHHAYATERMGDINDGFAVIRHAPLRYQLDTLRVADWLHERDRQRRKQFTDRLEYTIRAVAGALFGFVLAFSLIVHSFPVRFALAVPVITAAAATLYGDAFWRWVLRLWWLWGP
jgi:hypothetical protein